MANKSRVALITGGARGIGRAIAEALRARGDIVLTPTRAELDLASIESVKAWLNSSHPSVDVLVNNAGENPICPLDGVSLEDWNRAMTVNLTAPMLLLQSLAREMCAQNWGRIVNISSCYSIVSRTGRAPYGAAKAGLNSLTRSAALEFGPHGVLVNAVCPGFVETDLTHQNNSYEQILALAAQVPLGRLAFPTEIACLVSFLTSNENTYITGQSIVIDGGFLLK
jgi:3-oxoacyl-[acyl-carrier protein] reductase